MKAKSIKKRPQSAKDVGNNNPKQHENGVYISQNTEEQVKYFESLGEIMEEDMHKCEKLLNDFAIGQKETLSKIQQLLQFTTDEDTQFDSGINFYSCKNLIFNEYLICLKFYQLFKLKGIDFTQGEGLNLYQRLVYLKTLIMKLSPVQKKLDYQKNKLLKKGEKASIETFNNRKKSNHADKEGDQEEQSEEAEDNDQQNVQDIDQEQDNLMFKPRVNKLISAQKNKKATEPEKEKYVPVKQTAILPTEQKHKRREERQKQRKKAFLLRKFRGDIDSGDQAEEKGLLDQMDEKFKRKYEEKTLLEEENFARFGETKKQKFWRKKMMKNQFQGNQLNDELKQVSMIRQLVDEEASKRSRPFEESRPKIVKKKKKQN